MRYNRPLVLVGIAAAALTAWSCSEDPIAPGATASVIAIASGNAQNGIMGGPLANPIVVRVTDLDGDAVPGAVVSFTVTGGGGSVASGSVSTDVGGMAGTAWTLGSGADATRQTVMATVTLGTTPSVTFTATASPLIEVLQGDAQSGEVAQPLPDDPTIVLLDAAQHPVPGVTVTWRVVAGGGAVTTPTSVTDASGKASVPWTIGPTVGSGVHTLEAVVGASTRATFTASGVLTAGTIGVLAGDGQSGFTGRLLSSSPRVIVRTPAPAGLPVAGVEVQWSVTAGGGSVTDDWGGGRTNTSGVSLVDWKLGASPGANSQELSASVPGLVGSPVTFVASAMLPPGSISMVSGDGQTGELGSTLPAPLVVLVRDEAGNPLPGATVRWEAYDDWGYGSLTTETDTTDGQGQASMVLHLTGAWAAEGSVFVSARADGLPDSWVNFSASTLPGPAFRIERTSGDFQSGTVGSALPLPIQVTVKDSHGNPKPGVTVQWHAGPGSGSIATTSSVTDVNGLASTSWTIGNAVGSNNQSATATVTGLVGSPVTFTASATAGP